MAREYLDPVRRARRRHAGARLHPLPAADRRHLLRHGRRRHAGVVGRGDRQGRLPGARRRRPAAPRRPAAARPGFSTTGDPDEFRGLARRFLGSRGRDGVRQPRRRRWRCGEAGREGHRRRLLRVVRRPAVARVLLPGAGRARRAAPGTSLLDLGSGALGTLQQHIDPHDLDAIVLSHLHPDHCVDLCGLYVVRRYRPEGPLPHRLPVLRPDRHRRAGGAMYHGLETVQHGRRVRLPRRRRRMPCRHRRARSPSPRTP